MRILFKTLMLFFITTALIAGLSTIPSVKKHAVVNTVIILPQGNDFEQEWKKVDSLEKKGLTRSAIEVIDKIYAAAIAEKNTSQSVKSIIYRLKFESYIEEDSYIKSINDLKKEADNSFFPLKPILHSVLAEVYWRYYQNNRWRFLNRTETINFIPEDIRTWDLKKIFNETISNYHYSLLSSDSLKRIPISYLQDIIKNNGDVLQQKESISLRPTVYDFLAHRAVDFFMNEESGLTSPAYKFEINNPSFFSSAENFSQLNVSSQDSFSLKFHAIKLLQSLLSFHLSEYVHPSAEAAAGAIIDADLKRLKFIRNNSILENKDSLFLAALNVLQTKYGSTNASASVSYEIALYHFEQGNGYNPLDTEETESSLKWKKKEAMNICEETIKKFPESKGAKNCKNLVSKINEKSLSLIAEDVNIPNTPFRSLLKYKNTDSVYFRVISINFDEHKNKTRRKYGKELAAYYSSLKPHLEWTVLLPEDKDYNPHSAEVKIPSLPEGFYVLLIGTTPSFSYSQNSISWMPLWVSDISYVTRQKNDGSFDVSVFNRTNGSPLKGVSAEIYYQHYSYISRDYEEKKLGTYKTDENGYFSIPPSSDYRNFYIDFSYEKDRLNNGNSYYQYRPYKDNKRKIHTHFFTDRSIYRPGQTIYFKGIVIESDANNEKPEIKTGFSSTVNFYDVNYQKVADLKLTTNEYGTFSGSFIAPQGVLNGQMHINDNYGSIYFSVEEYKRPKFEVVFEPLKGSYKLGEAVHVKGKAKAYSGADIDGAEVKYRVVRNASFPYRWYWRTPVPSSAQMEISNGTANTNEKGEFEITFNAIPDKSISSKHKPNFTYTVYADVTDINGETRSNSQYITVGYTALMLNTNIAPEVNKNTETKFNIRTTNLAGEYESAKGTLTIYKLKEKEKNFRERKWEQPDKFLYSKAEYYSLFPHDIYSDENLPVSREKAETVFSYSFDTEKSKEFLLKDIEKWKTGEYVLEATTRDKYGEEVRAVNYFTLFSETEKTIPVNETSWFSVIHEKGEPGEKAVFLIGSKEKNISVLFEIEHKYVVSKKEWILLNNEQKRIEIPIEEKHRGNFAVHFVFVKNNRIYSKNQIITVPHSNKELDIEFETFRNKLLPGQEEEWKVLIKNKKGEKIAAELMVSMYDASLDAFRQNNWYFNIYNNYYSSLNWQTGNGFSIKHSQAYQELWNVHPPVYINQYNYLNWFGFHHYYGYYDYRYAAGGEIMADFAEESVALQTVSGVVSKTSGVKRRSIAANKESEGDFYYDDANDETSKREDSLGKDKAAEFAPALSEQNNRNNNTGLENVTARSNFNETAFFYPQLNTNEKGEVIIKFTVPESLTKWKFSGFAHTKDLMYGLVSKEVVTQKELMVTPNAPRFFRENDKMVFTAKITNLSEKDLTGSAQAFFYNPITLQPINNLFITDAINDAKGEATSVYSFTAKKEQSTLVKWHIKIPEGVSAMSYKIVAKAGNFSDGEEAVLPVLTNSMLVTEAMPLPVKGDKEKTFRFEKLIKSNESATLKHHKLTLEFTSNPAWYAVQALPYMIEYPYECAEQTFSRYYANSIASHIAGSSPKIKAVFESWKSQNPEALLSNLEKNQELKSLMLEETPWVLDAKNETERKKRIALLFDINKMSNELEHAIKKLNKAQVSNGGWPWFPGMPESRYITQHIVTGFGHLDRLGIENVRKENRIWQMVKKAVPYLDDRIRDDYDWLIKNKADLSKNHLGHTQIQYLYARSYFKDIPIDKQNQKAFDYYFGQAKKYWLENNRYMQGMIALSLFRYNEKTVPSEIIKSLKENSITNEELGMYWKDMSGGYYWYQAPIETQALLIEAFDEVAGDVKSVEEMKIWLLKNKQTNDWKTTKATAEACYALLLRGGEWLADDSQVKIKIGKTIIDPSNNKEIKTEAGTGYFKTSWSKSEIIPEMGEIVVTPPASSDNSPKVRWGAVYWQYFEQLDKITPHETPLKLNKKLFVERMTDSGPVIEPVTNKTKLKPGDKIKVRIELRVDRAMEYVHMKDMRASGLEPTNVFSGYKWQDGLGYYESTKDAATNFFFDYLPKGTYVFEYPLRVNLSGDFSNGITSIQCMYAPEFGSHSEGIRINIQ